MRLLPLACLPLLLACGRGSDPLTTRGGGSSINQSSWGNVTAEVFSTGNNKLYYALVTASQEFEPMNPPLSYQYSFSIDHGGSLLVDGRRIGPSPTPRVLALNPFGRMEEFSISPAEADIVVQGKPLPIWEQVVLPHLAIVEGKTIDGVRVGHWTVSGKSGTKGYEGGYVDGKRDGQWKYYSSDGKLRATVSYRLGKLHGEMTDLDPDGKVLRRVEWKDDIPVGAAQTWTTLGRTVTKSPDGGGSGSIR